MEAKNQIIVAMAVPDPRRALELVLLLEPHVGLFKFGLEWFHSMRANLLVNTEDEAYDLLRVYRELWKRTGTLEFTDAKLDDIENTVGAAAREIARLRPTFFNVHASVGPKALKAAVASKGLSKVLAVTVLTSHDNDQCESIFGVPRKGKVWQFAQMAQDMGVDGLVCSGDELDFLRGRDYPGLCVVPGIRPKGTSVNDQKVVNTPFEAARRGADYLVVGRAITNPPESIGDPVSAAKLIAEETQAGLEAGGRA